MTKSTKNYIPLMENNKFFMKVDYLVNRANICLR